MTASSLFVFPVWSAILITQATQVVVKRWYRGGGMAGWRTASSPRCQGCRLLKTHNGTPMAPRMAGSPRSRREIERKKKRAYPPELSQALCSHEIPATSSLGGVSSSWFGADGEHAKKERPTPPSIFPSVRFLIYTQAPYWISSKLNTTLISLS